MVRVTFWKYHSSCNVHTLFRGGDELGKNSGVRELRQGEMAIAQGQEGKGTQVRCIYLPVFLSLAYSLDFHQMNAKHLHKSDCIA